MILIRTQIIIIIAIGFRPANLLFDYCYVES